MQESIGGGTAGRQRGARVLGMSRAVLPNAVRGCSLCVYPEETMEQLPNSGYAVGWGTLALINAGFAEMKGRSRAVWFVLSLVLGPIATMLLVFVVEGANKAR